MSKLSKILFIVAVVLFAASCTLFFLSFYHSDTDMSEPDQGNLSNSTNANYYLGDYFAMLSYWDSKSDNNFSEKILNNPIDERIQQSNSADSTVAGSGQNVNTAINMWQAEMDGSFQKLLSYLKDRNMQEGLQDSQDSFNIYMSADSKMMSNILANTSSGSASETGIVLGNVMAQRYKERTIELKAYIYRFTNEVQWYTIPSDN